MPRLIDANALLHNQVWLCGGFVGDPYCAGYMDALDKVEAVIRESPTVDAVEVVRCKDCKWFWKYKINNNYCCCRNSRDGYSQVFEVKFSENDFCSYGERKDNDI